MSEKVKILHLEDSLIDSELIRSILDTGEICYDYFLADNETDYLKILETENVDIILSDCRLPDYDGSEALKVARELYSYLPFIFVSGTIGENAAIHAMVNGATDYVFKNNLKRLVPAIKRALYEREIEKERNQTLKALHESEERYRNIFENASVGISRTTPDGHILLANSTLSKMLGYDSFEEFSKLNLDKEGYENEDQRNEFRKRIERDGSIIGFESVWKKKDGQLIFIRENGKVFHDRDGSVLYYECTVEDITERKIREAALKRQLELEILNKDLEQFAFIASHDLQEPLRTVSNYIKLFEEDYLPQLDDNARKYLHSVNKATQRMSNLIKELLEFARLGHNINLTSVDCNKLIDNVIADLGTLIKTSNTIINVAEMPTLNLYESEIRELFQNLIINAIKFQEKGAQPKIGIHSVNTGDKWKFSVSDNGIGISPNHFERVFDLFKRLHANETGSYEGNGIGLAHCKKIVQMHQGEIWIESKVGQGTTFYFTIPKLIAEQDEKVKMYNADR